MNVKKEKKESPKIAGKAAVGNDIIIEPENLRQASKMFLFSCAFACQLYKEEGKEDPLADGRKTWNCV